MSSALGIQQPLPYLLPNYCFTQILYTIIFLPYIYILFPLPPIPLFPPLLPPFADEETKGQKREPLVWDHAPGRQQTSDGAPAPAAAPPTRCPGIPFYSVWGTLVVINLLCLLWPSSKRGLSLPKRNLLFLFASKFFLFSCLEKVVRWPIQWAIPWFRNKYVVQLSLSRCWAEQGTTGLWEVWHPFRPEEKGSPKSSWGNSDNIPIQECVLCAGLRMPSW